MPWVEVFAVFVVAHLVGDYLFQTDWQAVNKRGGLGGNPQSRRALVSHVVTYTLAFVPGLIWLADDIGTAAIAVGAAIFFPHLIQDDGRLLSRYIQTVKGCDYGSRPDIFLAVDQTFHVLTLFLTALVVGS
jgi:hypothetical protein